MSAAVSTAPPRVQSAAKTSVSVRGLAVLGALLLAGFVILPHFTQPAEDAVILYQYSGNLAHTGVISFYPGGPRAEGATDFLWMLWLAAGVRAGISAYALAIASSAGCVVLLAMMLLRVGRQRITAQSALAVTGLILLAPQVFAANAGFSVYVFGLLLASMAAFALSGRYGLACVAALLLCLTRPDGVVFALPLLAVWLPRGPRIETRLAQLACGFVVPGIGYFLWRWSYFHHLLPLPFYVKSDTSRVAHLLVVKSAVSLLPPLLAACAILAVALGRRALSRRNLIFLAALLVPSSLFYCAMRLDQNYANRFFLYPLVVMAVMLAANFDGWRQRAGRVLIAAVAIWVVALGYFWLNWFDIDVFEYPQPQVAAVARALHDLPEPGIMIVTESGAIPFYSQWQAIDPWGLNTPEFSMHLIQPADVAALHPDLIILHRDEGPLPCAVSPREPIPHTVRTWENMVQNTVAGIEPAQYTQWLLPQYNRWYRAHPHRWNGVRRPGTGDYQCWFIRRDYLERAALMKILASNGGLSADEYTATGEGR